MERHYRKSEVIERWNARAVERTVYIVERTCHIEEYEQTGYLVCSECGAVQPDDYTVYYCPNCGTKINEVDE